MGLGEQPSSDGASTTPLLHDSEGQSSQQTPQVTRNKEARTLPEGPLPPLARDTKAASPDVASSEGTRQHGAVPEIHHVVIVHNPHSPATVLCPYCNREGLTIQYKASGFCTWFTASLCCFMSCCLLVPFVFCCDSLKDTVHYCSHCRRYLGRTPA